MQIFSREDSTHTWSECSEKNRYGEMAAVSRDLGKQKRLGLRLVY